MTALQRFDWWIFRVGGVLIGVGIATSPLAIARGLTYAAPEIAVSVSRLTQAGTNGL